MRIRSSKLPLIILVLIVIMIVLTIVLNRLENKPEDYSGMTDEELAVAVQKKVDSMELHALGAMEERDRIEYYLGEFIDALEKSKYEKAYNMLNEKFKQNYFPKLEDFQTYAKTKFPMMFSIEHTNIERNGNTGIGKPEPLKGNLSGFWSRRIDDFHRIVYRISNDILEIASCRDHYE